MIRYLFITFLLLNFTFMDFKYGFYFRDVRFGWKDKHLYRLPFESNKRYYGLKKLKQRIIGNKVGYKVMGKPKTLAQLQAITQQVDWKVNTILNKKDLPF